MLMHCVYILCVAGWHIVSLIFEVIDQQQNKNNICGGEL